MFNTRVLITGGRKYANRLLVYKALSILYNKTLGTMTVIEGGATGADALACDWCKENRHLNINHIQEEAEWDTYGKKAGMLRNTVMAKLEPDICLAFRGGRGTMDMIDKCNERNIKVKKIGW